MTITAPISDEQFETLLSNIAPESIQAFLRARDTTQRAALAQVEAERDTAIAQMQNIRKQRDAINKELGDTAFNLCIAQQQLAEAMKLIDQHYNDLGDACGAFQSQNDVNIVERFLDVLQAFLARQAQAEQQEAPKRGKPDWSSHGYDQIFQTSDGNWFGARAGWDFKGHISGQWKGREVSLLRDDGGFLAYGEPNPDWESSLEQRPAQEAQGAQVGDEHEIFEAWHRSVVAGDPPHEQYHDGSYVNQHVNRYWTGWQARAALDIKPAVQVNPEPVAHLTVEVRGRSTKVDIEWPNGLHTTLPAGEYPLYTIQAAGEVL